MLGRQERVIAQGCAPPYRIGVDYEKRDALVGPSSPNHTHGKVGAPLREHWAGDAREILPGVLRLDLLCCFDLVCGFRYFDEEIETFVVGLGSSHCDEGFVLFYPIQHHIGIHDWIAVLI